MLTEVDPLYVPSVPSPTHTQPSVQVLTEVGVPILSIFCPLRCPLLRCPQPPHCFCPTRTPAPPLTEVGPPVVGHPSPSQMAVRVCIGPGWGVGYTPSHFSTREALTTNCLTDLPSLDTLLS